LLYTNLKKLENTAENNSQEKNVELIGIIEQEINRINSILRQKLIEE